jgi:hypothetical protein
MAHLARKRKALYACKRDFALCKAKLKRAEKELNQAEVELEQEMVNMCKMDRLQSVEKELENSANVQDALKKFK